MKNIATLLCSICLIFMGCQTAQSPRAQLDQIIAEVDSAGEKRDSYLDRNWPMMTDSVRQADLVQLSGWLDRLIQIDTSQLDFQDQVNLDMLTLILDNQRFLLEYGSSYLPLNSEGGFLTGMLYQLQNMRLSKKEKRDAYLEKLKKIPAYLTYQQEQMNQGLKSGKTIPGLIVSRCLPLLRDWLDQPAKESIFLGPLGLEDRNDLETALHLIKEEIQPAFESFYQYLSEEYLPKTRTSIGATEMTDGADYYAQRVRFFTTLDISPEAVFEKGKEEVARIRAEMDKIIQDLAFEGDFAAFLHFLRTDPQFYAQSPQDLLDRAAWFSKRAEAFLPKYFGKLPRMPFTVEPVPDAIAPNYTGGRYSEGNIEGQKPGAFWVNTYRLETRPLYVLPALTLHEAVPGHHLQIMLAAEMEAMPTFRTETYLSAFGEGWALYAEYLGKEAGMYQNPYEDFGRLTYEMWRACRLVVDVGMHAMNWTRAQAVQFMSENTALSMHEINTEIDRYIGWPAQALSYKMGEITIRELRQKAELEMGEDFDIRAFHDVILENGSIPMKSLIKRVETYIKTGA